MFLNWSWDDGTVRAKRRKRWLEKWIVGLVCVGLCGIRPRRHSTGFQGGPLVALEADVLVGDAGVGQDQARHLGAPFQVEVVQPVDVALAGHRCSVVGRRWRIAAEPTKGRLFLIVDATLRVIRTSAPSLGSNLSAR